MDTLYIVVPCYNEEEVLPETSGRLKAMLNSLIKSGDVSSDSRIMFVNDGSKDKTWGIISALHGGDKIFDGVCLSRNRGHQNALLAGLMTARRYADIVVSMDADLQDDMNAVGEMVRRYKDGCDIVYGVRSSREKDSFFKRFTAEGFYKVTNTLGGEVVFNHADYRLMSKRALDSLAEFGEVNLFLRGLVPMLGYKTGVVEYERGERFAGESKYPLKKMLSFAWEGITSLSAKPMELITGIGGGLILAALIFLGAALIFGTREIRLWGSAVSLSALFCGLNLLGVGIVGQYVGKIYLESKRRPRYIIESILHRED